MWCAKNKKAIPPKILASGQFTAKCSLGLRLVNIMRFWPGHLTGFGIEKHDDLVDALTTAIIEYFRDDRKVGTVTFGRMDIRAFGRRPTSPRYDNSSRIRASMERMPDGSWRHLA
jgi:hypothetical protein